MPYLLEKYDSKQSLTKCTHKNYSTDKTPIEKTGMHTHKTQQPNENYLQFARVNEVRWADNHRRTHVVV